MSQTERTSGAATRIVRRAAQTPFGARPAVAALAAALLVGSPASAQTARQGLLSLDDARIFYEVVGNGDPIVVVHGGPGLDHQYLQPGLDALAIRNTLVYYDQRGTGRSVADLSPESINLDTFVQDIEELRQVLGYERITLLGHSFGSLIALEYGARHPEAVRALVLMNPSEPGQRYAEQLAGRQAAARTPEDSTELAALTGSEGFAARSPAVVSQFYRVLFRQALRDRTRISALNLDLAPATAENGFQVAELLGRSMAPLDWWDRLPDLDVPTLVIHGRYDIVPSAMSRALSEALPRGRLVTLASGHFPYLEDSEGLIAAISAFFVDLSR